MSPQRRKHLDPKSKKFEVRFSIILRGLVDKHGWGPTEFAERLNAAGMEVGIPAIKKWLNAGSVPRPQDMETIGDVLGLADYRKLLPAKVRAKR